jgi:YnbE-like lipoprotein
MKSMNWMRCEMVRLQGVVFLVTTLAVAACTPRVEVAAPEKPITINLNVKIDHEIRLKVDKDLEQVFSDKSGLF